MRSQVVNFRAEESLVAALAQVAQDAGVTVSDVIRDAVRGHVGQKAEPVEPAVTFNPFGHLAAAARGDLEAQRTLAQEAERMVMEGADTDPFVTVSEGLVFARLAAEHGDIGDHGRVIGMLALAGRLCSGDIAAACHGEALARIAILADEGVDMADIFLSSCAEEASPQIMAMAQHFRARMLDIPGVER